MIRTFKYPLHPTAAQELVLTQWLGVCCDLYNAALQHRRDAWKHEKLQRQVAQDRGLRHKKKYVTYREQAMQLTQIRASDPSMAAVPALAQRSALQRVDWAFSAFFRRARAGETPGYPRFRARHRYSSFSIGPVGAQDDGRRGTRAARVRVPNLGLVRFHEYRPLKGRVRNAEPRRTAGRWFVCFVCEVGAVPEKKPVVSAVGVDLGLSSFATLSDGTAIENPRFFRKAEAQLALRQQRFARRKKGSKSRARAKLLVQKAHEHVRQQRLDFARKLACALFLKYDLVAYEDLDIRRLASGNFAKAIPAVTLRRPSRTRRGVPSSTRSTARLKVPASGPWP